MNVDATPNHPVDPSPGLLEPLIPSRRSRRAPEDQPAVDLPPLVIGNRAWSKPEGQAGTTVDLPGPVGPTSGRAHDAGAVPRGGAEEAGPVLHGSEVEWQVEGADEPWEPEPGGGDVRAGYAAQEGGGAEEELEQQRSEPWVPEATAASPEPAGEVSSGGEGDIADVAELDLPLEMDPEEASEIAAGIVAADPDHEARASHETFGEIPPLLRDLPHEEPPASVPPALAGAENDWMDDSQVPLGEAILEDELPLMGDGPPDSREGPIGATERSGRDTDGTDEIATRLERIAFRLRQEGAPASLLRAEQDPLGALIAAYLLGYSEGRESRETSSGG